MNKVKTVKIKNEDGSISTESYNISADARNIDMTNGYNVQDTIGTIDVNNDGSIVEQLNNIDNEINNVNLDIADINNKIEKKTYYFNNITAMKAYNLKNGECAITLGYYEANDGGGGTYQIVKDDTLTDDGGSVHDLANGNKAKLIVKDNRVNILQYGCYKNNESKYLENTSKIQTALLKFNEIIIPSGSFYIDSLNIPSCKKILGNNNQTSRLIYVGENNKGILCIGNINTLVMDSIIDGISISHKENLLNINGIELNKCVRITISNCHIVNISGDGIKGGHITSVNNIEIKQNYIINCNNNINLQQENGQINAIWIHHNDIAGAKQNGILFYGCNVIIDSNTLQANKKHAISVGDNNWDQSFTQYTYSSVITNNYTEQNGNQFENAVIGIYCGYLANRSYNRLVRNLLIENNYFSENQGYSNSIIDCFVDVGTDTSARACLIKVQNNFSSSRKFINFNFLNAISPGSIIKNNSVTSDLTEYPYYIDKTNFDPFNFSDSHSDGYQKTFYNERANFVNNNTQLTYLIYFDSNEFSESMLREYTYQIYSKIIVNGYAPFGNPASFNYLAEKIGSNASDNDGSIKKEIKSGAESIVPFISPITLVKNCSELTGNTTLGLQITLIPNGYYNFPILFLFEMLSSYRTSSLLKIKKTTPTIKSGTTAPDGNIDYIGQVYLDKTSKKWYVAETLTTWREASTN